jgi:hypothetical protein
MRTTKKHIRKNTRRIETIPKCFPRQRFNYWYRHTNNIAFELRWYNTALKLSWIGMVIKHNDASNSCFLLGHVTSKKQFVDVVYDYLINKNKQS